MLQDPKTWPLLSQRAQCPGRQLTPLQSKLWVQGSKGSQTSHRHPGKTEAEISDSSSRWEMDFPRN